MPDEECELAHRYVIATRSGLSPVFHTPGEAANYQSRLVQPSNSAWVAFHETPVEVLIQHPETIEIYCAIETRRVESSTPTGKLTSRS